VGWPVVEIGDLAAAAHGRNAGEGEVGEEPGMGRRGVGDGEDAIVWKACVHGAEGGSLSSIHIESGGPWGGTRGGSLEDEALLFEGAGAAAEHDAVVAGWGVCAAGHEEDGGTGFAEAACEEWEFGIVADEDADAGSRDVEGAEFTAATDGPQFAFEAGHLDFVLETGLAVGGAEPGAVGEGTVRLEPWERSCEDGDLVLAGEIAVVGEEGIAAGLQGSDAVVEAGADGFRLEGRQFHGGVFREDEESCFCVGGGGAENRQFLLPCFEGRQEVDGVLADRSLHGAGARDLVQKVSDFGEGAVSPVSFHVKWVWRSVRWKPRRCQNWSSGM